MLYEITVSEITEDPVKDSRYPVKREIYSQEIADLNVKNLARFINREGAFEPEPETE